MEGRTPILELYIKLHDLGIPLTVKILEELKYRYRTMSINYQNVYARLEVPVYGLGKKRKSLESRILGSKYLRYDFRYIQGGPEILEHVLFGENKIQMTKSELKKKIICLA